MIAPLALVKEFCRVSHDDDDATLTALTEAAEDMVLAHLRKELVGAWPASCTAAVLLLVSDLYDDRAAESAVVGDAVMPLKVRALLAQHRDLS